MIIAKSTNLPKLVIVLLAYYCCCFTSLLVSAAVFDRTTTDDHEDCGGAAAMGGAGHVNSLEEAGYVFVLNSKVIDYPTTSSNYLETYEYYTFEVRSSFSDNRQFTDFYIRTELDGSYLMEPGGPEVKVTAGCNLSTVFGLTSTDQSLKSSIQGIFIARDTGTFIVDVTVIQPDNTVLYSFYTFSIVDEATRPDGNNVPTTTASTVLLDVDNLTDCGGAAVRGNAGHVSSLEDAGYEFAVSSLVIDPTISSISLDTNPRNSFYTFEIRSLPGTRFKNFFIRTELDGNYTIEPRGPGITFAPGCTSDIVFGLTSTDPNPKSLVQGRFILRDAGNYTIDVTVTQEDDTIVYTQYRFSVVSFDDEFRNVPTVSPTLLPEAPPTGSAAKIFQSTDCGGASVMGGANHISSLEDAGYELVVSNSVIDPALRSIFLEKNTFYSFEVRHAQGIPFVDFFIRTEMMNGNYTIEPAGSGVTFATGCANTVTGLTSTDRNPKSWLPFKFIAYDVGNFVMDVTVIQNDDTVVYTRYSFSVDDVLPSVPTVAPKLVTPIPTTPTLTVAPTITNVATGMPINAFISQSLKRERSSVSVIGVVGIVCIALVLVAAVFALANLAAFVGKGGTLCRRCRRNIF